MHTFISTKAYSTIFTTMCLFWPAGNSLAAQWIRLENTTMSSSLSEMFQSKGLSCFESSGWSNDQSNIAICKPKEIEGKGLSIYQIDHASKQPMVLADAGDATQGRIHQFLAPDTIKEHAFQKNTHPHFVLVDLRDEGSCYATEVFSIANHQIEHLGTIDYSAIQYTATWGVAEPTVNNVCLGQFGEIHSEGQKLFLQFRTPHLVRSNPITAELQVQTKNTLRYRLDKKKAKQLDH